MLHETAMVRSVENAAAAQIAHECRGVLSGMPQPPLISLAARTPRAKGEDARFTHQQQAIEAELAAAIARPGKTLDRLAEKAYAAEVHQLSWSNPAIASSLQAAVAAGLEDVSTPALSFCADARAWTQSGYLALSAASREFDASREARESAAHEEVSLGTLLEPYESAADRALIRKTRAAENKLLAGVFADLQVGLRLDRIVGFPPTATKEPRKQTVLGRGRTGAGTRFQVSSGTSGPLGSLGSCRRSASVSYSRLGGSPEVLIMGGPDNPICLSPPQERHPALFCEAGIETIQTAVPRSVRSVRLLLADGHAIDSRVIRIPPRDGGPAGIYAQEIQGDTSHAVTLIELNASNEVALTLNLPRYRCVKSREQQELPIDVVELATGSTPEGQPFSISAFGQIDGEPFLSADTGVNPEIHELALGLQAPKAFPWSLSIGCAPHPYAILYGLLAPPGESVTALTPQGAVALNVVPLAPRLHAKGPLVYGVFSALPTELTVLGPNGSTVYAENLQAQAANVAQFCEGYAEP
ncbi:MAG TPA: hypothetical protein VHT29_08060 [Solirubrobacteraceae bacterium]|nr:hypothetical protein [Solirubrobacteraceae bacterium]